MNILHLSNTPLSNSPANLAKIQDAAGHQARVLLHRQNNVNKVFVGGELWNTMGSEQISEAIKAADVIHLHNFAWEQELFKAHPGLIPLAQRKRCLIQYHSPRNSTESFETTIKDPFFKGRKAVIAQFHVRQYPEAEHIVPNVLPINDPVYMPLASRPDGMRRVVSYAPSNVNLKGWEDKGYALTTEILRRLEHAYGIQADIIVNTPYSEAMLKKKWADVGIDEVITGSYHLSFLEYMSMGVVAVGRMDDATRAAMSFVIGWDAVNELPSINTNINNLEQSLLSVLRYRDDLRAQGAKCRQWMEQHWNPERFVKYYEEIYAKL
jgi:hypothetical protein